MSFGGWGWGGGQGDEGAWHEVLKSLQRSHARQLAALTSSKPEDGKAVLKTGNKVWTAI